MKEYYSRRNMLKKSALTAGGLCTCQILDAFAAPSDCCNTPHLEPGSFTISQDRIVIDLAKAPSLAEAGHAVFISQPDEEIELIVVRPDKDQFIALSRFCTHGRQVLSYNKHWRLLQCNSYNHSLFKLDGEVYKGPAPHPLDMFEVEKKDQKLTIYL